MLTEVEGVSKGSGLQGGEPEKGLDDYPQEEDVDVGGDHEGKDEVIKNFGCRRLHALVGDEHGQEKGEGADKAEEKDILRKAIRMKSYLRLTKTIRHSPL